MAREERKNNLKRQLISRLMAENCWNLPDRELERCLNGCCAPWLTDTAKSFRDEGFLTVRDIAPWGAFGI